VLSLFVRKVGIYFRGKLIKHDKGDGHTYPWIVIRLNESHELFKVLRDRNFFSKEIEGYVVLPEDVLREILGEDLYNKLLGSNDDSGDGGSLMAPAPQRDARDNRGVSERGVSQ
jgi:hypothetical protein